MTNKKNDLWSVEFLQQELKDLLSETIPVLIPPLINIISSYVGIVLPIDFDDYLESKMIKAVRREGYKTQHLATICSHAVNLDDLPIQDSSTFSHLLSTLINQFDLTNKDLTNKWLKNVEKSIEAVRPGDIFYFRNKHGKFLPVFFLLRENGRFMIYKSWSSTNLPKELKNIVGKHPHFYFGSAYHRNFYLDRDFI